MEIEAGTEGPAGVVGDVALGPFPAVLAGGFVPAVPVPPEPLPLPELEASFVLLASALVLFFLGCFGWVVFLLESAGCGVCGSAD